MYPNWARWLAYVYRLGYTPEVPAALYTTTEYRLWIHSRFVLNIKCSNNSEVISIKLGIFFKII